MTIDSNSEAATTSESEPPQALAEHTNSTLTSIMPSAAQLRPDRPPANKTPRFPHSSRSRDFRRRHFPDATQNDWNNWHWQLQNTIRSIQDLDRIVRLSDDERAAMTSLAGGLPLSITPYYASLMNPDDPSDPLRRTMIPTTDELARNPGEAEDPLGEETQSPIPGLIHRYPDRALFLVTEYCSAYCRYCTRSRLVGQVERKRYCVSHWQKAINYIQETPAIRDVIISGGDPLTLPDEPLEWLLQNLRAIKHVEIIRIGTKTPAVLPMRMTSALTKILRKANPLWMSLHFTHPGELTPETAEAASRLADSGLPLGSQTVLLRGINDNVPTMRSLMTGLLKIRVRPYYIYQCDPILGSAHFRTPVEKGIEIIQGLRGHISGYAVPQYVIDAPGGGGKIPLLPEYYVGRENGEVVLRNYKGNEYRYPDMVE